MQKLFLIDRKMDTIVKKRIKKAVASAIDSVKKITRIGRKKYKLIDFYGCFKGQITYDEDIFNFAE